MVQRVFKVNKSTTSSNGWEIEFDGKILQLPDNIYDELEGKYLDPDEILEKIDTMQIAVAGVTDSLNIVDLYSMLNRSVLKTFGLKSNLGTIDDEIDNYLESIADYEKYHTIYMDRDIDGNDGSIHAYLETPKSGKLRVMFDKASRLNAKRNNIKYWIDDYNISTGSAGGEFVRPVGKPIEIM